MRFFNKLVILAVVLISFSCASSKDMYRSESNIKYKKIIFSTEKAVLTAEIMEGDIESGKLSLTSPLLPGMTINGQVSNDNDEIAFYVTDVRLFSNWENGWTEGFFEASGKYLLNKENNKYSFSEVDPFELWDIVSGEIRYNDTYYRADDGMWKVKNRIDRLKEISRILQKDFDLEGMYGSVDKKNSFGKSFEAEVLPVLFPELNEFEKLRKINKLPKSFYGNTYDKKTVKGSSIKWRDDYTKSVFPEQLWDIRNTGTMLRDAQEAPEVFLSLYNIKGFIENILLKETIVEVKE